VLIAGLVWAGAFLMVGVTNLIWPGYGTTFLQLVASVYPGYEATGSVSAVIVGTVYALFDGAIFGLFSAGFIICSWAKEALPEPR